ncbi:hypothetical protein KSP39_PZI017104 [Platanthera zijinensis]|uniref:Uncharacterized protein n=1 Tax=Platanthera zijinensis TaxID=2320716 RepID=A0AAP0FZI7_9ASPA
MSTKSQVPLTGAGRALLQLSFGISREDMDQSSEAFWIQSCFSKSFGLSWTNFPNGFIFRSASFCISCEKLTRGPNLLRKSRSCFTLSNLSGNFSDFSHVEEEKVGSHPLDIKDTRNQEIPAIGIRTESLKHVKAFDLLKVDERVNKSVAAGNKAAHAARVVAVKVVHKQAPRDLPTPFV